MYYREIRAVAGQDNLYVKPYLRIVMLMKWQLSYKDATKSVNDLFCYSEANSIIKLFIIIFDLRLHDLFFKK